MKFTWRGETFETVDQSDLTWVEMEQLEEATGFTSSEIQEDPKVSGRARVVAALCWMSVRRQNESVTFADFFGSKISEFQPQVEGEEETVPPPPVDPADPLDGTAGNTSEDSGTST